MVDTKEHNSPKPKFVIKDLGIVIENKLEVSKGSYSFFDSTSNVIIGGSNGSNKASGNSLASGQLKFG